MWFTKVERFVQPSAASTASTCMLCYTNGNDATSALWNLPFLFCGKEEEEEEHTLFVRCMHHRFTAT